jgi:hypothetical protein
VDGSENCLLSFVQASLMENVVVSKCKDLKIALENSEKIRIPVNVEEQSDWVEGQFMVRVDDETKPTFTTEAIERTPLGYMKPLPSDAKYHPTSAVRPEEDSNQ